MDDLLIVESRNASDVHVLALPLAYIYARHVLVLSSPAPDKPTFAAFLEWAQPRYRRVLFMGGGGTDLLSSHWSVRAVASERFQIPEYDAPNQAYPQGVATEGIRLQPLRLRAGRRAETEPFDLDVGVSDDLNVIRFHAKETHRRPYVPLVAGPVVHRRSRGFGREDRTLALWMSNGGRPPAAPPADVTRADRRQAARHGTRRRRLLASTTFAIPPDLAASLAERGEPVRLMLRPRSGIRIGYSACPTTAISASWSIAWR